MDDISLGINILVSYNNPNHLTNIGASGGWCMLLCRLCGEKGAYITVSRYKMSIRYPWVCDKCRDKENITNEKVTL